MSRKKGQGGSCLAYAWECATRQKCLRKCCQADESYFFGEGEIAMNGSILLWVRLMKV